MMRSLRHQNDDLALKSHICADAGGRDDVEPLAQFGVPLVEQWVVSVIGDCV